MGSSKTSSYISVFVLVAFVSVSVVSTQETPSCASKLIPCQPYLNDTSPPANCCDPLRDAIDNELQCLCNLFNSQILGQLQINVTQALELPQHCGINKDLNACSKGSSPSPTGAPPGSTAGGDNGASGMAQIGISGLAGLLFLWLSVMV